MKAKNLLKKAFLLLALMGGASSAWADTETPGNTGSADTQLNGTSYFINGTYIAGSGGVQITPMESKGVKLRSNKTSNTLVVSVSDGYRIDALTVYGVTNDNSNTVTVDAISVDGVSYSTDDVVIPNKKAETAATISITGIAAKDNITFTFSTGAGTQLCWDFHFTYTKEKEVVQEVTAVALNGSAISDDDLATLKSTGTLEIDGSSLNGLGTLDVTLSSGATTVSREIVDDDAVYTFSINSGANEYTITVTDVAKTYSAEGSVMYYSKNSEDIEGKNTKTVTANGISMSMVDGSKTFQYGTGSVRLGSDTYVPLKLSTGSAVNVTFPDGKVATKVIVYGWSASGNGAINSIKETLESTGTKSLDTHEDVFYATNTATDTYPSVYEYDLDNWESLYFNPGGSTSQPFVVMDFVLVDKSVTITPAYEKTTYVTTQALDFTDVEGLDAYVATAAGGGAVTLLEVGAVPAGTPLMLIGTAGTEYTVPAAASASAQTNMFRAGDGTTEFDAESTTSYDYILFTDGKFYRIATGTTVPVGKAYLHCTSDPTTPLARELRISFGDDITGINQIDNGQLTIDNSQDGKFIENGKLVIVKNGVKYNAAGAKLY